MDKANPSDPTAPGPPDGTQRPRQVAGQPHGAPTADEVLALALAVAAPGERAHLYDSSGSNELSGWCSLQEAAENRLPFVVSLADDVLGVDLDQPEELAHLVALLELLQSLSLLAVVVASGQQGRRHIFAYVPPGQRSMVEQQVAALLGNRTAIKRSLRPPLSPHRNGLAVHLVEPAAITQALHRLRRSRPAKRLSNKMFVLLREGDTNARYRSRSEVIKALITAMVDAHWVLPVIRKTLLDKRNIGGRRVQEIASTRGAEAADRCIREEYEKSVAYVKRNPVFGDRKEVIAALVQQRTVVADGYWPGASGQKQQVVMTAALDMAIQRGSITISPGLRRLAELTGMTRPTVKAALDALVGQGWLKTTQPSKGITQTYTLNLKKRKEGSRSEPLVISPVGGCERSGRRLDPGHDAFRHGAGLGKPGLTVLSHLQEPLTVLELVKATGLSRSTVKRLVATLVKAQAVEKTDAFYQATGAWPSLALALALGVHARRQGTHLAGLAQRAQHANERQDRQPNQYPSRGSHPCVLGHGLVAGKTCMVNPITGKCVQLGPEIANHDRIAISGMVGEIVLTVRRGGYPISLASSSWSEVVEVDTRDLPIV